MMKKELPVDTPEQHYYGLPLLALQWEAVKTALLLNVFDCLGQRRTCVETASLIRADVRNTEVLLNALTALKYLEKKDGYFHNTEQTELFLTTGKDTSLAEPLLFMDRLNKPVLHGRMMTLVKEGAELEVRHSPADSELAAIVRKMVNFGRCGRAQHVARLLSERPEFGHWQKVLDLGAGSGLVGIAIAAAHPSLTCHLLDRPAVIEVAEELIAEYGVHTRVKTISGDFINDSLGDGYDAIIASHALNTCRSAETLNQVLEKCHAALKSDGCLIVISEGLSLEKTHPSQCVVNRLASALQGRDFSFTEDILPKAILTAGFRSIHTKTLTDSPIATLGPVDFHFARKGV